MKKLAIVGISILVVVFLLLSSQSSVVGYRVTKDTQQNLIQKTVTQSKTNLLTLKSLFKNSKQSTGVFSGIYLVIALIHFIIFFIFFFVSLWGVTDHSPGYLMPILLYILMLFCQFFGFILLSMVISLFIAAIWPLVDLFVILFFNIPLLKGLLIKIIEFIEKIIGVRPWKVPSN